MIVRKKHSTTGVDWGNGRSFRLLVDQDGLGFTLAHTHVSAGTESKLQYRRHLEACYCIDGRGEIITEDGVAHPIEPGVLYALDAHDAHTLRASPDGDLELISVFNPPLTGEERHVLSADGYSQY